MHKIYQSPDCYELQAGTIQSLLSASNEDYIVDPQDPGFNF